MGRSSMVGAMTVVLLWPVIACAAEQSEIKLRSFDRFEQDSETADGLWAEIPTLLEHEDVGSQDIDLVSVSPRVAYGWPFAEVGLIVPYLHVERDFSGDDDSIGDVRLYGKGVARSQYVDGGIGMEFTFPSGDEDELLGAGEVGFLPYGTAAVHLGPVDGRVHLGYLIFADDSDTFSGFPSDAWFYGWGFFAVVNEYLGLRAEFNALNPEPHGSNVISFQPGLDGRLPLGPVDLYIRPTGAVGLSDSAPDWGVGGSVAIAWDPMR